MLLLTHPPSYEKARVRKVEESNTPKYNARRCVSYLSTATKTKWIYPATDLELTISVFLNSGSSPDDLSQTANIGKHNSDGWTWWWGADATSWNWNRLQDQMRKWGDGDTRRCRRAKLQDHHLPPEAPAPEAPLEIKTSGGSMKHWTTWSKQLELEQINETVHPWKLKICLQFPIFHFLWNAFNVFLHEMYEI